MPRKTSRGTKAADVEAAEKAAEVKDPAPFWPLAGVISWEQHRAEVETTWVKSNMPRPGATKPSPAAEGDDAVE